MGGSHPVSSLSFLLTCPVQSPACASVCQHPRVCQPSNKRAAVSSEALGGADQLRCQLRPGFRQASTPCARWEACAADDAGGSKQGGTQRQKTRESAGFLSLGQQRTLVVRPVGICKSKSLKRAYARPSKRRLPSPAEPPEYAKQAEAHSSDERSGPANG